jgi:hypothetical protein
MEQPASDYDGVWKVALDIYFEPFLALFFPVAHAAIDWIHAPLFRDTELQQVAPEETKGKQRVDRLVQVVQRDGTQALVLIHIEIQSQRDTTFAERMFRYHARIFDRERRPVVSLAVLGDADAEWQPTSFEHRLWGCELLLRFPVVKLLALNTTQLAALANPIATLTLMHRDAQDTRGRPAERLVRKVERYRAMWKLGYRRDDIRALLRLMEYLLRLDRELAEQAFVQMQAVEREETGMDTVVTSFEEIGFAKGVVEGERALVLRLLTRKLGALSTDTQTRIAAMTADQVVGLGEALLDFTTADDLVSWLDRQPA